MVCMLDEYSFELRNVETTQKKLKLHYAKHERIGNHPAKFAVGKWEESFDLDATFYHKSRSFLTQFEEIAKRKKPVWLVFPTGEALRVTIEEISITKSYFDESGSPLRQDIKLTLEGYYE